MNKILILTLFFAVSCVAKSGNEKIIDDAIVKQIKKGVTKTQVVKLLGYSNDVSIDETGSETWTYQFQQSFRDPTIALTFVLPYGGLVPGPSKLEQHYLYIDFRGERVKSFRKSRNGKLELPKFLQRKEGANVKGGSKKTRERRRGR